jgi:nitroreductase
MDELYNKIFTRKSTRKFVRDELDRDTLKKISDFISTVKPLLPETKLNCKIVGATEVKGMMLPKAPHFLLIYGKEQPLRSAAGGYLGQYAELFMYSIGLATRWLGGVKPKIDNADFVIGIAFGKPAESASRTLDEFKRKSATEIANTADNRFDAVRLAPSGMNGQPWYFIKQNNAVHCYYKKSLGGLVGKLYKMTDLDIGIALAHLHIASEHENMPFNFSVKKEYPVAPKGFVYVGTADKEL